MRKTLLVLAALTCVGCADQNQEGLGHFALEGQRLESCGDTGFLASPSVLIDTVYLRRGSQKTLQWEDLNGLLVVNLSGDSGAFFAERFLSVDAQAGTLEQPPDPELGQTEVQKVPQCVIERYDTITGVLAKDRKGGYTGFTVQYIYAFGASPGSDCSALTGPDAIAAGLPCSIAYDAVGERE
jgi:hypothetical protein